MSSGDTMGWWQAAYAQEPPSANYGTFDTRNGHPVIDLDASTDESWIASGFLPNHYSGGGLTIQFLFSATGITSGNAVFNVSIERIGLEVQDTDSDGFASAQSTTVAVSSTDGYVKEGSVSFTSGAQMDSLAAGEEFRIKITRDADNGSDTAAADVELRKVIILET